MTEQEVSPDVKKAVQELFVAMSQKSSVEDFPLKDVPCEYWWVRYAVACTYLNKVQQKLWEPKIKEMQEKYNFNGYSYSGSWGSKAEHRLTDWSKAKIWVWSTKTKKEVEVTNQLSELWRVLSDAIENHVSWFDCPYQMEHQSKCPFYKPSEWYLGRKELSETEKQSEETKT